MGSKSSASETIFAELLDAFPVLRSRAKESAVDGQAGVHVILGELLNPMLTDALEASDDHTSRAGFAFIERLAAGDEPDALNAILVTVAPHFGDDPELLSRARRFMGPHTLKAAQDAQDWYETASRSEE